MCEDSTANSLKEPQWHKRTGFRFGNLKLHMAVSIWHIIFCLAPLATVLLSPRWSLPSADQLVELAKLYPQYTLLWISIVALGYPAWAWIETMVFERWVRKLPDVQRSVERANYQLHVGMAKNFWQAVLYMYTAAGLIGTALKAAGKC